MLHTHQKRCCNWLCWDNWSVDWGEPSHQAEYISLLADECTDNSIIEELSVVIRWVENGIACGALHWIGPKADASTIYGILTNCMKKKELVIGNMIEMGFDGAATFSGRHNGALLNKNSPYSIFVHYHCHLTLSILVQAAKNTQGIKHVYTILTTLWK